MLKLTTDKQRGQKQYDLDHSIRGHKNKIDVSIYQILDVFARLY